MQDYKVSMRKKFKGNYDDPMRTITKEEQDEIKEVLEKAYKKRRYKL